MKNIYLYIGTGANQAMEVENCLTAFDVKYERICEHQFETIEPNSILIIPGGDPSAMLQSWSNQNKKKINQFVSSGGIYIGICAGVFVADFNHLGLTGLGLVKNIKDRKNHQQIIKVKNVNNQEMEMIIEDNPDLSEVANSEVILKDDENNLMAIKTNFGSGQVYLFGVHPEGSVYYKKSPYDYESAKYFVDFIKELSNY